VIDIGQNGGIWGEASEIRCYNGQGISIPLAGTWKYKVGYILTGKNPAPTDPKLKRRSTVLYNGMIHPFIGLPIRGVIWYQGESNISRAEQYGQLFPEMIRDWRTRWGIGAFPFCFVQIPNYRSQRDKPQNSAIAELREAQAKALTLPNIFMTVNIDIGDSINIHPKNKQEVGRRLALAALENVYEQDVISSGPIFKSMHIDRQKVILNFEFSGDHLKTSDGKKPEGFAIAGADKQFLWANAEIRGKSVVLWNLVIEHPVAVRYAWADNPKCNLIDESGLPAAPFRTDNWPGITTGKK
jgi:sialate O-acetylesterase